MANALTIQQVSRSTGLGVHTLRYYERIGLLRPIPRRGNGHRQYRPEDLDWIDFILRLRATGMPVEKMRRYAQLREVGNEMSSIAERKAMLEQHASDVATQLQSLAETLDYLRGKIALYSTMENERKEHEDGRNTLREGMEAAAGGRRQGG